MCVHVIYQEGGSLEEEHFVSVEDGGKVCEAGLQLVNIGDEEVDNIGPRLHRHRENILIVHT